MKDLSKPRRFNRHGVDVSGMTSLYAKSDLVAWQDYERLLTLLQDATERLEQVSAYVEQLAEDCGYFDDDEATETSVEG